MANVLGAVALLIAVLALLYAWRLHTELDRATSRLDRYNKALFDVGEELRLVHEQLDRLADVEIAQDGSKRKRPPISRLISTGSVYGAAHTCAANSAAWSTGFLLQLRGIGCGGE